MGFTTSVWTPEKFEELRRLKVDERLTYPVIAEKMGLTLYQVQKAGQRLKLPSSRLGTPVAVPETTRTGIGEVTLSKVKERFDIKSAIYKELAVLARGTLLVETELCQRVAGNSSNERARFTRIVETNEAEFKPLRMRMKLRRDGDEKWYWGHKDDVAEAVSVRDS